MLKHHYRVFKRILDENEDYDDKEKEEEDINDYQIRLFGGAG